MHLGPASWIAVSAALLAACAGPGAATRAEGWQVATSEGFTVWTDAGADVAARACADLERLQATLGQAFPDEASGPRPRLRVILLGGLEQVASLAGPHVAGFYTSRTASPTVVTGAGQAADSTVLAHELAHHLIERWLPRAPRWLDEGLAEHLATAGTTDGAAATLGRAPAWTDGWRPEPGFVQRLLAWDGQLDPARPREAHREAWALVHFLATEEPGRLTDFLRALQDGVPAGVAFGAAFPRWRPDDLMGPYRLELRVQASLDDRRQRLWRFSGLASRRATVTVRPAPPADVHLLRLELPRRGRWPAEAVRAELAAALRADPAHPEALRWLAQLERLEPLPLALRSVEAHPEDWRSWRFLAFALPAVERARDREAALQLALALEPGRPELLLALARHLAAAGRLDEAEPLARAAAEAAPWDPSAVTGYAAVAVELDACPVSRPLVSRATVLGADPALDPERRALAQDLRLLAFRCDLGRFTGAGPQLAAQ